VVGTQGHYTSLLAMTKLLFYYSIDPVNLYRIVTYSNCEKVIHSHKCFVTFQIVVLFAYNGSRNFLKLIKFGPPIFCNQIVLLISGQKGLFWQEPQQRSYDQKEQIIADIIVYLKVYCSLIIDKQGGNQEKIPPTLLIYCVINTFSVHFMYNYNCIKSLV